MLQEVMDEIEKTARSVVDQVHTAMPGKILSYDPASGRAVVLPCGKFVTSDGKELDYPQISEVPVVFPYCQTAGVGMAFPLNKGDSCIVIISEVELDAWRSGAESEGSLRFDLTSAVLIPGLMHSGAGLAVKAAAENAVVLGTPDAMLTINSKGLKADIGETVFEVSDSGISVGGDLNVKGNISYTGTCQMAE